jgi:5-methylcytosine-specific restriction endonuclease McrA
MDTSTLPKTRSEAKAQGAKYYFTGDPCKHGHIAPRKTKGVCVECMKAESKAALVTRADYFASYNKSYAGTKAKRDYYDKNRTDVIARAQARTNEAKHLYRKRHKAANPEMYKELTNARRRRYREATPSWLSAEQKLEIRFHYRMAIALSRATGMPHAVDHIVPIQGEDVCGMHVPWNMQVITQDENLKKSNKFVAP